MTSYDRSYDRYAAIRDGQGLTDYKVAKGTGIGSATFSNWKNGKYTPKQDKIEKIAEFLKVNPNDITAKNVIQVFRLNKASSALLENDTDTDDDNLDDPVVETTSSIELKEGQSNRLFKAVDLFAPIDAISKRLPSVRISLKVPVLGRVAAGIPNEAIEDIIGWECISEEMAESGDYFGLQIKGDSMEPRMRNGDVVIVRKQEDADNGDTVIALVNGSDAVCKKLKKYSDGSIALMSTNPAYDPMFFAAKDIEDLPVRIIGKVKELRAKY